MTGTLDMLFLATVAFVGSHFLLSSQPVREPLVGWLGRQGFMLIYSLVAVGTFLWMLLAYGAAPVMPVWFPPLAFYWIPVVLVLVAAILVVSGLTTRSPTAVGGDEQEFGPEDPAPGILRITRHPVLCGTTLWSLGHLASNGNLADIVLFGGILVLSVGGMAHIDQKREQQLGAAWGPIALTTSVIPFAAILSGRTSFDWAGIGFWRPLAGVALYMALLLLHPWMFGASALPPL
jgi:uncharacterized membrane protein